jgi:hypothetical protein
MPPKTKFNCLNCNELCRADARNIRHQRFCSKPECRRASKAASQRLWTERPENQNYFKGPENCERAQQWRKAHPDHRRNKRSAPESVLQEILISQPIGNVEVATPELHIVLQDVCLSQSALFVGLISVLTGHVLQDDLAPSIRSFITRGLDILGRHATLSSVQSAQPDLSTNLTQAVPRGDSGRIGELADILTGA